MQQRFRTDDRVLSLAIPSFQEAAALARVLMNGCLVALGNPVEVDQARQSLAEFDNVMFLSANPEHIPWQDAFFTKILVPVHLQPLLASFADELNRVLIPGGEIITNSYDV